MLVAVLVVLLPLVSGLSTSIGLNVTGSFLDYDQWNDLSTLIQVDPHHPEKVSFSVKPLGGQEEMVSVEGECDPVSLPVHTPPSLFSGFSFHTCRGRKGNVNFTWSSVPFGNHFCKIGLDAYPVFVGDKRIDPSSYVVAGFSFPPLISGSESVNSVLHSSARTILGVEGTNDLYYQVDRGGFQCYAKSSWQPLPSPGGIPITIEHDGGKAAVTTVAHGMTILSGIGRGFPLYTLTVRKDGGVLPGLVRQSPRAKTVHGTRYVLLPVSSGIHLNGDCTARCSRRAGIRSGLPAPYRVSKSNSGHHSEQVLIVLRNMFNVVVDEASGLHSLTSNFSNSLDLIAVNSIVWGGVDDLGFPFPTSGYQVDSGAVMSIRNRQWFNMSSNYQAGDLCAFGPGTCRVWYPTQFGDQVLHAGVGNASMARALGLEERVWGVVRMIAVGGSMYHPLSLALRTIGLICLCIYVSFIVAVAFVSTSCPDWTAIWLGCLVHSLLIVSPIVGIELIRTEDAIGVIAGIFFLILFAVQCCAMWFGTRIFRINDRITMEDEVYLKQHLLQGHIFFLSGIGQDEGKPLRCATMPSIFLFSRERAYDMDLKYAASGIDLSKYWFPRRYCIHQWYRFRPGPSPSETWRLKLRLSRRVLYAALFFMLSSVFPTCAYGDEAINGLMLPHLRCVSPGSAFDQVKSWNGNSSHFSARIPLPADEFCFVARAGPDLLRLEGSSLVQYVNGLDEYGTLVASPDLMIVELHSCPQSDHVLGAPCLTEAHVFNSAQKAPVNVYRIDSGANSWPMHADPGAMLASKGCDWLVSDNLKRDICPDGTGLNLGTFARGRPGASSGSVAACAVLCGNATAEFAIYGKLAAGLAQPSRVVQCTLTRGRSNIPVDCGFEAAPWAPSGGFSSFMAFHNGSTMLLPPGYMAEKNMPPTGNEGGLLQFFGPAMIPVLLSFNKAYDGTEVELPCRAAQSPEFYSSAAAPGAHFTAFEELADGCRNEMSYDGARVYNHETNRGRQVYNTHLVGAGSFGSAGFKVSHSIVYDLGNFSSEMYDIGKKHCGIVGPWSSLNVLQDSGSLIGDIKHMTPAEFTECDPSGRSCVPLEQTVFSRTLWAACLNLDYNPETQSPAKLLRPLFYGEQMYTNHLTFLHDSGAKSGCGSALRRCSRESHTVRTQMYCGAGSPSACSPSCCHETHEYWDTDVAIESNRAPSNKEIYNVTYGSKIKMHDAQARSWFNLDLGRSLVTAHVECHMATTIYGYIDNETMFVSWHHLNAGSDLELEYGPEADNTRATMYVSCESGYVSVSRVHGVQYVVNAVFQGRKTPFRLHLAATDPQSDFEGSQTPVHLYAPNTLGASIAATHGSDTIVATNVLRGVATVFGGIGDGITGLLNGLPTLFSGLSADIRAVLLASVVMISFYLIYRCAPRARRAE